MGYLENKSTQITIPSATQATLALTTGAGDKTLPGITIPQYQGKLIAAFLRYVDDDFNQATGAGSVNGDQYIQVSNGGAYQNAILIPNGSVASSSAALMSMPTILQGAIDIKALITPGGSLTAKWTSALVSGGTQTHYNAKLYLDLMFA